MNTADSNSKKILTNLLTNHARKRGNKTALMLLNDDGNEEESISYSELIKQINFYAQKLIENFSKGERCLIPIQQGIDFLIAYLSCLHAGMIAVPVNLPKRNKANERFLSIAEDAAPSCMMLDGKSLQLFRKYFNDYSELNGVEYLQIDSKNKPGSRKVSPPRATAEDIAYLQYTSGSTGSPKGVMISHFNLMNNSEVIRQAFGHDEHLMGVNWLPPFHDMGLVGTILQPLYVGGTSIMMHPAGFLKNPLSWFIAIKKYGAQTIGCPNFALDYCVDRIGQEEKEKIDLSSVKVLFCGAEPIRKKTLENFLKAFGKRGLKPETLLPCYGLAESTLMATGIRHSDPPEYLSIDKSALENDQEIIFNSDGIKSIDLVSCGNPGPRHSVIIADPASHEKLPEKVPGEIFIKGPSVARGYWNDKTETKAVFNAFTEHPKDGPYLRTGDLGFLYKGQLYISGRSKDLIIIHGVNHYPQHIEATAANSHKALQVNAGAAFSVDLQNQEQLVIVQEVQRTFVRNFDKKEIFEAIRKKIAEEHEISLYAIILISPGSIPKTTSGKVQRIACRAAWQKGELKELDSWKKEKAVQPDGITLNDLSIDNLTDWLVDWLSRKTETPRAEIDLNKPIISLGIDSIGAAELERELKQKFGIKISLSDLMEDKSVGEVLNNKNREE